MNAAIQARMAALRQKSIDLDDHKWDAEEIADLTKLARPADRFEPEGVSFLVHEYNSATEFEPAARQSLLGVLVGEAKVDAKQLSGRLPPLSLACREGNSNKFYQLAVDDENIVTRYGRIGAEGKTETKPFPSAEAARREYVRLFREKLGKGYTLSDAKSLGLEDLAAPKAGAPAAGGKIATRAAWNALDADKQLEILEYKPEDHGLARSGDKAIGALEDRRQAAFAKMMRELAAETTSDFEIHDDEYLRVGGTKIEVEIFTLPNGEIAGGTLWAFQKGCERPDDYWDNEDAYDDARLKELADNTDVSWSWHGTFAFDGKEANALRQSDYMEWSGY